MPTFFEREDLNNLFVSSKICLTLHNIWLLRILPLSISNHVNKILYTALIITSTNHCVSDIQLVYIMSPHDISASSTQSALTVSAVPSYLLGPGLRRRWLPVIRTHQLQGRVHHRRAEKEPAGRRRRGTSVIRLAFIFSTVPPYIVAILVSSRHSVNFAFVWSISLVWSCHVPL